MASNYSGGGHALGMAVGISALIFILLTGSAGAATLTVNAGGGADYRRIQKMKKFKTKRKIRVLAFVAFLIMVATIISVTPTSAQSSTVWLDIQESEGIVYFITQSPAHIERYDMIMEMWMNDITLNDTPTAFAVDTDGLYISFGRRTSRFNLDGTGEGHLHNTNYNVTSLFTVNEFLYICDSLTLLSVNKSSGTLIDYKDFWYSLQGIDVAPTIGKAFGRTTGISPSDIVQVILNSDGTLGTQSDSPYHGDFPSARKTFVFPGEARVADDSGIVYNTNDLTYSNSLAGIFDDMAFYGDLPIVLRDNTLVAYSNVFLETGRYTPNAPPLKIYIRDNFIYSFFVGVQGIEVDKIPIDLLKPAKPGEPVDPNGLSYVPDSALLGQDEVIYLLSRNFLSIFLWSVSQRSYLETIPLTEAPVFMAYSGDTNRLYLSYPSGKITQIRLNESMSEETFVNSPQTPCGLATAGEYVFVCDPSGAWVSHFTYSHNGTLISQKDWNYYSGEYIWNSLNRKMYFFRDDTSPNDLLWENIDVNGVIGSEMDSPYHSSDGIMHPIRVAPDGSIVVLGSGRIYDAISLKQINMLSNNIDDAVWGNSTLFTMRAFEKGTQLQKWGNNYGIEATQQLVSSPIRMFLTEEGLLVITEFLERPRFSIWDLRLNPVDGVPVIINWGNNKTNDAYLNIAANVSETIRFNANANQSIDTWNWFLNNINQNNNFDNFSHHFAAPGNYTIKVNASNTNGISDTVAWNVNVTGVTSPPVADCGPDKLKCENVASPLQFNASPSYDPDGAIISYNWDFGDGTKATGVAPVHKYSTYRWNGTAYQPFTVNLTVTDDDGMTNSTSIKVVIWMAGDANGDGKVNILDASIIGLKWNTADPCADLNNDGKVNILDASIIGLNWGKTPVNNN